MLEPDTTKMFASDKRFLQHHVSLFSVPNDRRTVIPYLMTLSQRTSKWSTNVFMFQTIEVLTVLFIECHFFETLS